VELVGAVALMTPAAVKVGALILMPVMAGAIYTLVLFQGHPALALVPVALLCMLVYVYWEHSTVRERLLASHPRRNGDV
jgi:hypothetical protein